MPTNPPTTLETIQTKVRKLTRSPSVAQLSTADLNDYINTFIAYDFPDHIRLFDTKTTFSFYCEPYQDVYLTDTSITPTTNPLYDFQNKYISIDTPLYIAGYESYLSQSREEFFNQYPLFNNIQTVATGNGVLLTFTGTLNDIPVLRNEVTFSSVDINNNGLALADDGNGALVDQLGTGGTGTINYVTGAYSVTFNAAPANSEPITAQTRPYVASRPRSMLFYDNKFTLRPVPDKPYKITFDAYMRPTAILAGENPQLQDWWQYIAYGAAKKVFEDRMDQESVNMIMPEFKEQERLVLRKTLANMSKERTATIYSEQTGLGSGPFGRNGGSFW
jgi:hypothetical protein